MWQKKTAVAGHVPQGSLSRLASNSSRRTSWAPPFPFGHRVQSWAEAVRVVTGLAVADAHMAFSDFSVQPWLYTLHCHGMLVGDSSHHTGALSVASRMAGPDVHTFPNVVRLRACCTKLSVRLSVCLCQKRSRIIRKVKAVVRPQAARTILCIFT